MISRIPEDVESITSNFIESTKINTFLKSPKWLVSKKCILNPQKNDNKCFQYSVTFSLYHQQIKNNTTRIKKSNHLLTILTENINFPPKEQDHQMFEMNNKSVALNILNHVMDCENNKKISHVCKSGFNKTREKQVILLIIIENLKQHYVTVKKLNALLKAEDHCFVNYCINCLKPFRTKLRLKKHQVEC